MRKRVPHIVVDAFPLVDDHFSGIGHSTHGFVRAIDEMAGDGKLTYRLVVPRSKAHRINAYRFKHYKKVVKNPISNKMIHGIMKFKLPIPLDLFVGRGHFFFPSYLAWPTWFSKGTVVIHDAAHFAVPHCVDKNNRKFLVRVIPFSIKNTQSIVTVSQFSKDELLKYYKELSEDQIHVAYNSVDRRHFYKRSPEEIHRVKSKYDIFSDKYILSVGNIEPRKNYETLVDAYVSLPKKITNEYPLVIVGAGGWNNEKILDKIQKAKENGYKIIHPKQFVKDEDMPALFSGASLFTFVPIYEGFGMSPLEAFACGTPVIASDIPPLHEVVGKAGTFVNHESVEEVSNAINSALTEGAKFNQKEVDKQLAKFDWRDSAIVTITAMTGLPASYFKEKA